MDLYHCYSHSAQLCRCLKEFTFFKPTRSVLCVGYITERGKTARNWIWPVLATVHLQVTRASMPWQPWKHSCQRRQAKGCETLRLGISHLNCELSFRWRSDGGAQSGKRTFFSGFRIDQRFGFRSGQLSRLFLRAHVWIWEITDLYNGWLLTSIGQIRTQVASAVP